MNTISLLLKMLISLVLLNIFYSEAMDVVNEPSKQLRGDQVVIDATGQSAHEFYLPADVHLKILIALVNSFPKWISLDEEVPAEKAAKAIRAWAHTNRNSYYTVNDEKFTRYLSTAFVNSGLRYPLEGIGGQWRERWISCILRTRGTGQWMLASRFSPDKPEAAVVCSYFLSEICYGDYGVALFAIDNISALRLDKKFLNRALINMQAHWNDPWINWSEKRKAYWSKVVQRLVEAGADPSRLPDGHLVKVQFSSSPAGCVPQ